MRALVLVARQAAILTCLGATVAFADWRLEWEAELPSFAAIEPETSNLNIDSVVLTCEKADDAKVLQLQIYLSTEGPLLPQGAAPEQLRGDPSAEITIDGHVFSADLLFADTYVVLADETDQMLPRLSEQLIDAMATGRTMVLRFDLLAEPADQLATFDGEAMIALQPRSGGATISDVRRCATMIANAASAWHDRR